MNFNRIVFMGTPEYALPTLKILVETYGSERIVGVFSQPVKARGRGRESSPTPVHVYAESVGLSVFTPHFKEELAVMVDSLSPDLVVVIAYGMILPKSVTDAYFCVNLHGSLLPKYRGASPMQAAILEGDRETGVTLIRMNERMDAGEILAMERVVLAPEDHLRHLHDRLSELSARVMINYLEGERPVPVLQEDALASYCPKIQKEDLRLDLTHSVVELIRKVKAYSPLPGAYVMNNEGKRVKILDAREEDGTFLPVVVKPEGKNEMAYEDYVRGHGELC
jgi:methionyl-tRNA formyltransferase